MNAEPTLSPLKESRAALLWRCLRQPRAAVHRLRYAFASVDPIFEAQGRWAHGSLPRLPLGRVLPGCVDLGVILLGPADRRFGTSLSIEELCTLLLIAKSLNAKNILEIGTWDGNTAVNLAANSDGSVTTVDLPGDFDARDSLAHPGVRANLTDRRQLGRQIDSHPCGERVRQVFGDSAEIDWRALGPPFDLVFIDGCHAASYVESDTENALAHLRVGGAIVWHDYGMLPDLSEVVDRVALERTDLSVTAIEGTRLAVGFKGVDPLATRTP